MVSFGQVARSLKRYIKFVCLRTIWKSDPQLSLILKRLHHLKNQHYCPGFSRRPVTKGSGALNIHAAHSAPGQIT